MRKNIFLFALLLSGGLGFSQETAPQALDKAEREAAKKAWKAEGQHAVGLRRSLLGGVSFLGLGNLWGSADYDEWGTNMTVSDFQLYYTFRFAKRWRVGGDYAYHTYAEYTPRIKESYSRPGPPPTTLEYYYHNLRLSVYFDMIQNKRFTLRGSIHVSVLASAWGGSYSFYKSSADSETYTLSEYRPFGKDEAETPYSHEFMLDAIYSISRHFECGLSATTRIQSPMTVGGFSLVLGYKF